jgi:hypothetical protein
MLIAAVGAYKEGIRSLMVRNQEWIDSRVLFSVDLLPSCGCACGVKAVFASGQRPFAFKGIHSPGGLDSDCIGSSLCGSDIPL